MKKFKNILSTVCAVMVTAMFAGGVSAAETSTEATTAMTEEAANVYLTEENTVAEVPAEPEIVHIADGEELPDYFYVVPKEKIQTKGEFSLEGLYAYIAIAVKHDYLDPKSINLEEFTFEYSELDLGIMQVSYYFSIYLWDQFSYSLADTYYENEFDLLEADPDYAECIVRAIFSFCEATNYEGDYLSPEVLIYEIFELTPDKITFSNEQLHYFDD